MCILITGAGRGFGLALAVEAAARGHVVVATRRSELRSGGLLNLATQRPELVRMLPLDVSDEASCATLVGEVCQVTDYLDMVINNAGINSDSSDVSAKHHAFDLETLSPATVEQMVRTNAMGPIMVTRALRPLLERSVVGARVVNVTSRRGALSQKEKGGNYGYCMSKAALNMATRAMAADLAPRGITVVAVHPGAIRTAMAQPDATIEPREAARKLLDLAGRLTPAHSGRFLTADGVDHQW